MGKGIVVAGSILVDKIKMIDSYPEKGMLVNISEVLMAVGGCVPNTIIDLAIIDPTLKLKAVGKIGNDGDGEYLVKTMSSYGINTSGITVSKISPTSFTDVMTERKTGDRTFFHARGAASEFSINDIKIEKGDCELFHIGYLLLLDGLDEVDAEYGTKMSRLLKSVQDKGIKTSIDVVSEAGDRFKKIVTPSLKYTDYCIINEVEAGEIAAIKPRDESGKLIVENVKRIMQKFFEHGVGEKVVVHAPECGFALDKNGEFTFVPSLSLPKGYIKGSVGAGDAFCAASLYSIYNNFTDEHMLKFASSAAACNLSQPDSISGMRNKEEIEKLQEKFSRREI